MHNGILLDIFSIISEHNNGHLVNVSRYTLYNFIIIGYDVFLLIIALLSVTILFFEWTNVSDTSTVNPLINKYI